MPRESYDHAQAGARKTVLTAAEMGYFKVPREATLNDVADRLDLSDLQVSRQLRQELSDLLRDKLDA